MIFYRENDRNENGSMSAWGQKRTIAAPFDFVRFVPETDMLAAVGNAVIASLETISCSTIIIGNEAVRDCESPGLVRLRLARARS